ncbi:predicted protein [Nematostella vectensis]|uniref:LamG-like jellyroll fold domain-containing protein n=1 Tax=Nematostella vectensis TaxID=45351 RepID=A7S999_NEMVE|nr:uncharacterized protein LOC5511392 [Nematostella vectensis]XP_048578609.1 uncharacterized protein LOC5511392 [Nematostella vectensis]EDO39745.1 predicted protein [Nematostella vectensis]|eukprot:XP_001631808.1 predicted protein [Nematostella vectensis]
MKGLIYVLGLCLTAQALPGVPTAVADASDKGLPPDKRLVCKLDFTSTKGTVVEDSSGYANNGYLVGGSILVHFNEGKCGNAAYTYCGDILFHGDTFQGKPYVAATIAAWVKLKEVEGSHSIFDTIGISHQCGQFHFEVNNGAVRWFHRNETQQTIFSCNAEGEQVKADKWTHIAGTYDSATGKAKVYINGLLRNMTTGSGLLSRDWLTRAGIGDHKANRPLKGFVDDFRIYNYALNKAEIFQLAQECGLLSAAPAAKKKTFDITEPLSDSDAAPSKAAIASSDDFLPIKKEPRRNVQNQDTIEEAVLKRSQV